MPKQERYFKVTITRNHRTSFDHDVLIIRMIIEAFKLEGFEFRQTGWELQPKGIHNMHIHSLCVTGFKKFLKYAGLHQICKRNDCVLDIEEIFTDINKWVDYCKKEKNQDLAYNYAASTRMTDKGCVFLEHIKVKKEYEPTEQDLKDYEEWLQSKGTTSD